MSKNEKTAMQVERALNRRYNARQAEIKEMNLNQKVLAAMALKDLPRHISGAILSGKLNPCGLGK